MAERKLPCGQARLDHIGDATQLVPEVVAVTRPRILDLFCGACGGWSLGLHRAGFHTVAAVEIDEWRRRQFGKNFPDAGLYADVRSITAKQLTADGVGPIDLVCGSPPCQDASSANTKGRGIDGERTGLYMEAVRIVGEVRPRWCAFENVPGIRNRGIDRVLGELEAAGYAAWPLVVGALDLGAPHIRKRSWVVCADAATVQRLALPWGEPDRDTERDLADTAFSARQSPALFGQRQSSRDTELGDGTQNISAADSASDGRRQGRPGRPDSDSQGEQDEQRARAAADAVQSDAAGQASPGRRQPRPKGLEGTGDAIGAGLEIERGEPGDNGAQRPPLERAIAERLGPIAETWNGGITGRIGVDDGLPKGMARPMLAAFGDAILPQISEIIGRAILTAERAIEARRAAA